MSDNNPQWKTDLISPTCEYGPSKCSRPTSYAYKTNTTGWMALCEVHAAKHFHEALPIEELIKTGEKFA